MTSNIDQSLLNGKVYFAKNDYIKAKHYFEISLTNEQLKLKRLQGV